MKAKKLTEMSSQALQDELIALRREQFNLRMQRGSGQAVKPHLFKKARRTIARIKTIVHQNQADDKS